MESHLVLILLGRLRFGMSLIYAQLNKLKGYS